MLARRIPVVALFVAAAVVVIGPWVAASDAAEPTPPTGAVVQGNNAFALALYAKLQNENKGNVFLSPYSISTALAMTYAGARGKTAAEMAEVLHFTVPQEQLPSAFAALAAKLHGDVKKEGYQLRIANRLWGQTGEHFLPEFLQLTRDDFGAELAQLDFAGNTEAARRTINTWVEKKTEQKIKDLIAPGAVNSATTLVLTNAIYFKGDWQMKFEGPIDAGRSIRANVSRKGECADDAADGDVRLWGRRRRASPRIALRRQEPLDVRAAADGGGRPFQT